MFDTTLMQDHRVSRAHITDMAYITSYSRYAILVVLDKLKCVCEISIQAKIDKYWQDEIKETHYNIYDCHLQQL